MYLAHESSGNHNTYTRGITHWAGMLVGEHMQKGHEAYIVNLMFWPIPGSEEKIVQQMHSEAHRAYRLLLNRIVRDWHSKANVGRLPVWILVPDRPVYKREKKSLRKVSINNGLHLNGVILNSPETRMKERLDHYIAGHQRQFVWPDYPLARLHAKAISHDPDVVADYVFKTLKRNRTAIDDILIIDRP